MPDTENRIDKLEREIRIKFAKFNTEIDSIIAQFVTERGVDELGLRNAFRGAATSFATDLSNVYLMGGQIAAAETEVVLGQAIAFDSTDLGTIADINELRNRVITGLQRQQEEAIMEMRRAQTAVVPIRSVEEIRRNLKLTGRQAAAVANYLRLLEMSSRQALTRTLRDRRFDSTVNRAIESGKPLTTIQIDRMVERYQQRQLARRAQTIAATEAVRIANQSDRELFRQLINSQQVRQEQLTRTWITSFDSKVRDSHNSVEGVTTSFDEPWITSNGNALMFPGDPAAPAKEVINCRCWVRTDVIAA